MKTYQELFDLLPPVDQKIARTKPGDINLVKALLREERLITAIEAATLGDGAYSVQSPTGKTMVTVKGSRTRLGVLAALDLGDGTHTPEQLMAAGKKMMEKFRKGATT